MAKHNPIVSRLPEKRELDRILRDLHGHVDEMLHYGVIAPDRHNELTAKIMRAQFLVASG